MAEGGASTRRMMSVLGQNDIKHAELHSRYAEQSVEAAEGMGNAVAIFGDGEP